MNTSEDKYRNKTSSGDVPPKPSIGSQNNSAELEEYGKASNENENKNDKTKEAHRFVFVLFCFVFIIYFVVHGTFCNMCFLGLLFIGLTVL